ncbi:hypothetical protein THF5G08_240035 [Vibrio jasicida]|nr:hypothetical protein THF5G08_240035 [Vibrio jasicida]
MFHNLAPVLRLLNAGVQVIEHLEHYDLNALNAVHLRSL